MGFRSTFTTSDYNIQWPQWFRDKYRYTVIFAENGVGALNSICECKIYVAWPDLPADIQRVLISANFKPQFVLVYLHECGGITRCEIAQDGIWWNEPKSWEETEYPTHYYCYGCSDAKRQEITHG